MLRIRMFWASWIRIWIHKLEVRLWILDSAFGEKHCFPLQVVELWAFDSTSMKHLELCLKRTDLGALFVI
jgi:hypothetical protein